MTCREVLPLLSPRPPAEAAAGAGRTIDWPTALRPAARAVPARCPPPGTRPARCHPAAATVRAGRVQHPSNDAAPGYSAVLGVVFSPLMRTHWLDVGLPSL